MHSLRGLHRRQLRDVRDGDGDNCSNPITISASGQHRTVITTCGASNDLDTVLLLPCGWAVADVS